MEIVCAKCRKPYIQAVRQQGVLDRLLSPLYIYPFRCQICRHRFYLMQRGLRYIEIDIDRREYVRRPVRLPAKLLIEDREYEGMALDLSMGGSAVETHVPFQDNTLLSLHLDAFDLEPPIIIEAAIVRTVKGTRIGLEFLRFASGQEQRLSEYLLTLWLEGTQMARKGTWQDKP